MRTAFRAKWASNPGRAALRIIYDIYTSATGDRRRFSDNCDSCITGLLADCGKFYFQDMEELQMKKESTKEVKVSEEAKKVVKRAKVKTTKKD